MSDQDWTIPALKEYFDKLRERDQEAIRVLANNFEKRMDNTNEWRGVIEKLLTTYVTKGMLYSSLGTALAVAGLLIAYFSLIGAG